MTIFGQCDKCQIIKSNAGLALFFLLLLLLLLFTQTKLKMSSKFLLPQSLRELQVGASFCVTMRKRNVTDCHVRDSFSFPLIHVFKTERFRQYLNHINQEST